MKLRYGGNLWETNITFRRFRKLAYSHNLTYTSLDNGDWVDVVGPLDTEEFCRLFRAFSASSSPSPRPSKILGTSSTVGGTEWTEATVTTTAIAWRR
ncbi:putative U protein [Mastadenovirus porcusquartum]|uniref:U protein n=2 Tax=Mastadenovirus porcusquartum TaxID=3241439 RepID=A0A7H0S555_9ADEN|nr:putative U protein [Porcine mastadenovirus B]QNQ79264.1 putative U protein [Porcine mastadenovirus B]